METTTSIVQRYQTLNQQNRDKAKKSNFRKNRLRKCDKNFWTRAMRLHNIERKTTDKPNKKLLTQMYMTLFRRRYNELDSCSWRVLCNCGKLNPLKKTCAK